MAETGEKGADKGFRVEDRRRFSSETGEAREEANEAVKPRAEEPAEARADDAAASEQALPEISFSTFVIGLSTQALMHMGEIPDPVSGKLESSLPVAKQMIDIIAILREKTRGNLDPGEEKLLDDVLYDLRMKYVRSVKGK